MSVNRAEKSHCSNFISVFKQQYTHAYNHMRMCVRWAICIHLIWIYAHLFCCCYWQLLCTLNNVLYGLCPMSNVMMQARKICFSVYCFCSIWTHLLKTKIHGCLSHLEYKASDHGSYDARNEQCFWNLPPWVFFFFERLPFPSYRCHFSDVVFIF